MSSIRVIFSYEINYVDKYLNFELRGSLYQTSKIKDVFCINYNNILLGQLVMNLTNYPVGKPLILFVFGNNLKVRGSNLLPATNLYAENGFLVMPIS